MYPTIFAFRDIHTLQLWLLLQRSRCCRNEENCDGDDEATEYYGNRLSFEPHLHHSTSLTVPLNSLEIIQYSHQQRQQRRND